MDLDIKLNWTWICLWTWVCLTKKQVALWKPARNFDCGNLGSSHADRPIYFSPTLLHLNVLPSKPLLLYAHLLLSQVAICKQETTLQAPWQGLCHQDYIAFSPHTASHITSARPPYQSSRAALGSLLKSWSKHDLLSKQRLSINVFSEGHGVTSTKSAEAECASGSRAEGT